MGTHGNEQTMLKFITFQGIINNLFHCVYKTYTIVTTTSEQSNTIAVPTLCV